MEVDNEQQELEDDGMNRIQEHKPTRVTRQLKHSDTYGEKSMRKVATDKAVSMCKWTLRFSSTIPRASGGSYYGEEWCQNSAKCVSSPFWAGKDYVEEWGFEHGRYDNFPTKTTLDVVIIRALPLLLRP